MILADKLEFFAKQYGFEIDNKNIINKLVIDEMKDGIAGCPCVFKPSNEDRLSVLIEHRCPCKELIYLKQGESCKCGLFRKK